MKEFAYCGIKKQIPTTWNELTPLQVQAYVDLVYLKKDKLFFTNTAGKLIPTNFEAYENTKLQMLFHLLNLSWQIFLAIPDADKLALLYEWKVCDFLFAENTLTKNPFPYIKPYYGPKEGLSEICIAQYAFASSFHQAYKKTGDIKALNSFISVLYTPENTPFDKTKTDPILLWATTLDILTKISIFLYFDTLPQLLITANPTLAAEMQANSGNDEPTDWHALIMEMSGGVFGTFTQTEQANTLDFFKKLDLNLYKAAQTAQ